jgi:hypothetical protein
LSGIRKLRKFYEISAFNAQCSRVIIVVVQVGPIKIYVAAVKALREKERGDETQFPSLGGNTSLGPVLCFCKIRFPVKHLMLHDAETGHSRPPDFVDNFIVCTFFEIPGFGHSPIIRCQQLTSYMQQDENIGKQLLQ